MVLAQMPVVRGPYDSEAQYNPLDIVYVGQSGNGDSYVCVRGNIDKPVTDTEYWALMARGRDGTAGAVPSMKVSDHGTWVVNGIDTGYKLPQATDVFKVQSMPSDINGSAGKTTGYYLGDISHVTGSPKTAMGWAMLEVISGGTDGIQRITMTNDGSIWQRTWHDTNTFTSWYLTTQFN